MEFGDGQATSDEFNISYFKFIVLIDKMVKAYNKHRWEKLIKKEEDELNK